MLAATKCRLRVFPALFALSALSELIERAVSVNGCGA
jgi:hypothetical protein